MSVEIRAARSGDGAGLAQIWLDNARYYVGLFPEDFRVPDEDGLVDWFEGALERPRDESELDLVAVVDGGRGRGFPATSRGMSTGCDVALLANAARCAARRSSFSS